VTLTLIAEVLAGETRITPGGPVDTDTACGLEPFTWDHWLELHRAAQADDATELIGTATASARG
jgi:hypothetical protein